MIVVEEFWGKGKLLLTDSIQFNEKNQIIKITSNKNLRNYSTDKISTYKPHSVIIYKYDENDNLIQRIKTNKELKEEIIKFKYAKSGLIKKITERVNNIWEHTKFKYKNH